MKNTKHFLALLFVALLLLSCDKDYNTIGSGLVDEDHFNVVERSDFIVETKNVKFEAGVNPVQTNNLSYGVLGSYTDPFYGTTTSNVLSQVSLTSYNPTIGDNPQITKVTLSIPYFSTLVSTDADGDSTYELDKVYGTGEVDLAIYRSNYYLNDFDPNTNFEDRQEYYSDQAATFDGSVLEEIYREPNFFPENIEEHIDVTDSEGNVTTNKLSPRLRKELLVADFQWIIDPANADALISDAIFKNFYRGLYFKIQAASGDCFFGLNLGQANIDIAYTYELDVTAEDGSTSPSTQEASFILTFTGNRVNTFDNPSTYTEDSDKLYLKGAEGAMAVVDLFGPDADADGVADELELLRQNDWLINEANLEFYVDTSTVTGGDTEPERISIYDLKNNTVLLDYFFDSTSGEDGKTNHLGKLERDASNNGVKYKLNITEHIRSVIREDKENVSLGIVVSSNVTLLDHSLIKNSVAPEPTKVLSSSILSHQGTVLFNENAADDSKKLKLRIYYTEEDPAGI